MSLPLALVAVPISNLELINSLSLLRLAPFQVIIFVFLISLN